MSTTIEEVARLSALITTRLKTVHKELIDVLLEQVPPSVPPEFAADFVVTLIAQATYGLGVQMCVEDGMPDQLIRSILESIIVDVRADAKPREAN